MFNPEESDVDRRRLVRGGCDCLDCDLGDCSCVTGGSGRCLCDECGCGRDGIEYTFAKGGGHD